MIVSNICPVCLEPLCSWSCGNESCDCDDGIFESLVVLSTEGDGIIACPFCGFDESFSFWAIQNVELFIATQVGDGSLTNAGELHQQRKEENEQGNIN